MNPVKLARVAAEAEALRLRAMAGRIGRRIAFVVVALVFLLITLAFVHVIGWYALRVSAGLSFYAASGIVGGIDLLLALIFLGLASRSAPSAAEREALEVRRRAVEGMRSVMSMTQLALPTLRVVRSVRRRRQR